MSDVHRAAANRLAAKIIEVLDEQTVEVPGTAEFGRVVSSLARRLAEVDRERQAVAAALQDKVGTNRTFQIISSLPGSGDASAAKLLVAIGDGRQFPNSGHLAAYCGLAPVVRKSGTSIGSARQVRRGNLALKHIFYMIAMGSTLYDDHSKAFYQRKRAEGKWRQGALIALARRKADVLHAMLRAGTTYVRPEVSEDDVTESAMVAVRAGDEIATFGGAAHDPDHQ
jgi:transposase